VIFVVVLVATLSALAFTLSGVNAQESDVVVPQRLRYIFDLPWCKKWQLSCSTCEMLHKL
jgi:hypothetical protein